MSDKKYCLHPKFHVEVSWQQLMPVDLTATSLKTAREEAEGLPGGIYGDVYKKCVKTKPKKNESRS